MRRDEGLDDPIEREAPSFFCDAMLGGLARWLRAVGYEAAFEHGIDDAALVERAGRMGAVLLSSDRPLFDRKLVRTGEVRALFVPRHAPVLDQVVFVLSTLRLGVRDLRCMACGGVLLVVSRDEVIDEAPPRVLASCDEFFRCAGCRHLYWRGTHWARIEAARTAIARRLDEKT